MAAGGFESHLYDKKSRIARAREKLSSNDFVVRAPVVVKDEGEEKGVVDEFAEEWKKNFLIGKANEKLNPEFKPREEKGLDLKELSIFAKRVFDFFAPTVKCVVLFGSQLRKPSKESDIDILIVVDDVTVVWDLETVASYREELSKMTRRLRVADRVHLTTLRLSSFWVLLREADPAILNIVRFGEPLIDVGFFAPIKSILLLGGVKPTPEAVHAAHQRIGIHIRSFNWKKMSGVEDLFWACVEMSQAVLMKYGMLPPSPEEIKEMLIVLSKKIKDGGIVRHAHFFDELFEITHKIRNEQLKTITHHKIEYLYKKSMELIDYLEGVLNRAKKRE